MNLRDCYNAENNGRPNYKKLNGVLGFQFVAYDKAVQLAGEKKKKEKLDAAIQKIDVILDLSKDPKTEDELIDVLAFRYVEECPYHFGNFTEKEFIESNKQIWSDKLNTINNNLVKWVSSDNRNLKMLQSIFLSEEHLMKLNNLKRKYDQPVLEAILSSYQTPPPVYQDKLSEAEKESKKKTFQFKLHTEYLTPEQWLQSIALVTKLQKKYFRYPAYNIKKYIQDTKDKSLLDAFPGEFLDSVMFDKSSTSQLPDILPATEEICKMSEEEIEAKISKYVGQSIETLTQRLLPEGDSDAGFINEGERLGSVIKKDAELLMKLGIDRYKLADRMQAAILISRRQLNEKYGKPEDVADNKARAEAVLGAYDCDGFPWSICHISWMGTQNDPFHPSFDNPSCSATTDYSVYWKSKPKENKEEKEDNQGEGTNEEEEEKLSFGTLLPIFIRRLCFFETTAYRVDPELAHAFFFHPQVEQFIQNNKK